MKQSICFTARAPQHARGFSLVEVLVTFFVLSIGLMGLAALQVKAVQYNQGAYIRSQALVTGNMMMDMIRLNSSGTASLTAYNIDYSATPSNGTSQPSKDLLAWRTFLATALPDGVGMVSCNAGTRLCTVGVRWANRLSTDPNVTTEELLVKSQL
jgi:type IV pilus assembly protein PilV